MSADARRSSNSKSSHDRYDLDLEWDESRATATSWSAQINNSRPRGRRVYGNNKGYGRAATNASSEPPAEKKTTTPGSERVTKRWNALQHPEPKDESQRKNANQRSTSLSAASKSIQTANAQPSSNHGRAPLARSRVVEKTPQTLLQKLRLSNERPPILHDAIENSNPNISTSYPPLSSDEATTSSLSKRKRTNDNNMHPEIIQPHSSSSLSPAFSSHSAQSFTYGQLAAASSDKCFARFNSDRVVNQGTTLRKHMRFSSDPGGWVSSTNPAIDLRALLMQASAVSNTKKVEKNKIFSSSVTAIGSNSLLNSQRNSKSCSEVPLVEAGALDKKAHGDHISSSSSSSFSDGEDSSCKDALLSSKRMFISLNYGRKTSSRIHDDVKTSDSSSLEDDSISCDDNGSRSDSEGVTPPTNLLSYRVTNPTLDEDLLQQIIDTLPSRQTILFLLKQLKVMSKKQRGHTSFGASYNNNWLTIVPPNFWTVQQKNELIKWATKTFGFTLRNASAGVEFMEIKTEKASKVKALLETALRVKRQRSQMGIEQHNKKLIVVNEDALLPKLKYAGPVSFENMPCHQKDIIMEELPDISKLHIQLERNENDVKVQNVKKTSCKADRLPRSSLDQSLKSHDFVLHMTGLSPGRISSYRRTSDSQRLLPMNQMGCSGQRKIWKCESFTEDTSIVSEKISPVYNASSSRSRKLRPKKTPSERYASTGRDHISPLPQFNTCNKVKRKDSQNSTCRNDEQVRTPMLARITQSYFCCSQYPDTCDWGASAKCEPHIIELLLCRFEDACKRADRKVLQPSSDSLQNMDDCSLNAASPNSIVRNAASSRIASSRSVASMEEDEQEDDDSVVPMIGAPHLNWLHNHRKHSIINLHSSPHEMQKRQRDSLAKLHRQSICKAVKDFSPRRLTMMPPVPFLLSARSLPVNDKIVLGVSNDDRIFRKSIVGEIAQDSATATIDDGTVTLHCTRFAEAFLPRFFEYLTEKDLMCTATLVCSQWADVAAYSLAKIMLISVGCPTDIIPRGRREDTVDAENVQKDAEFDYDHNDIVRISDNQYQNTLKSKEKSWSEMNSIFPWACFLAEGAYKKVYRVWNAKVTREEAVSVMDVELIESMGNKAVIGAELAVSVLLSSLARRNICPNFVITRGIFSCPFEPPASHWGCASNRQPIGAKFDPSFRAKKPRQPHVKKAGKFQYIRMELCKHGDLEEFIANQPEKLLSYEEARHLLFQMAFSLYAASSRYGMKHYDVKLLNFFLQSANDETIDSNRHPITLLRYGVGDYIFSLRMPTTRAYVAKLADYGTADLQQDSNGNPVTLGQFTTLENSPPEQLILGDEAVQGFGHDMFGLGLCMLHLFTGEAPYEEILQGVCCPPALKKKLRHIWESGKKSSGFSVIRSVILSDVFEDDDGNTQGVADDTLYDTLYRFLVLFGIPKEKYKMKENGGVWKAIVSSLGDHDESVSNNRLKPADKDIFVRDRRLFSFSHGSDRRISRARETLEKMAGGVELLLSLVEFNPDKRSTALDVLNSKFMSPLRNNQIKADETDDSMISYSFMAFCTPSGK